MRIVLAAVALVLAGAATVLILVEVSPDWAVLLLPALH